MNTPSDNLTKWLQILEQRHPKQIELGLERVGKVATTLTLTHFNCPIVTVAGTNGKGSTVAILHSIFQAAGYKVGTYTSPHLLKFNERVRIGQDYACDQALCDAFNFIETNKGEVSLTYFEFTTLAALWLFQQADLDLLILEIGLGGRLDAVNIIDADISVITSIALDHMNWLGDNKEAIGFEKSGIMRANRPVVCGEIEPPQSLLQYAKDLKAPLYLRGRDYDYQFESDSWTFKYGQKALKKLSLPSLDLVNVATALQVWQLLASKLLINLQQLQTGLKAAVLPGRFQSYEKSGIQCILDVAHNPAGAEFLARQLAQKPIVGRTFAICAMLNDKDHLGVIAAINHEIDVWFVADLSVPNGAERKWLAQSLKAQGVSQIHSEASVENALTAVMHMATAVDRILVFGSFYTVAAVLSAEE